MLTFHYLEFIAIHFAILELMGLHEKARWGQPCTETKLMRYLISILEDDGLKIRVIEIQFHHLRNDFVVASMAVATTTFCPRNINRTVAWHQLVTYHAFYLIFIHAVFSYPPRA